MNWKDQWRSINNTFRTYASSAEFTFGKGNPKRPTYYALGAHFAKDVSGDVEFGNTHIGGNFAALMRISRNERLCFGVQAAYGRFGINNAATQWGSQYSGLSFDPSLFNGEGIEFQSTPYGDFSAGIAYWYHKNDQNVVFAAPSDARIGLAVYHINRPENAFTALSDSRLPMRIVAHGSALFSTGLTDFYWFPNATVAFQGPQHEILFGTLFKYVLMSGSRMTGFGTDMYLSGGVDFRINNVFDAVVPQFYIDFQSFSIGMSYDINVSGLNPASSYRGGFELSLRFTNPDGYTHKNPYRRGVSI